MSNNKQTIHKASHRTHSSDTCMYGPLPVTGLCGLLSEEEVHFIIVSVIIVWDEMGSDELRVCKKGCKDVDVNIPYNLPSKCLVVFL